MDKNAQLVKWIFEQSEHGMDIDGYALQDKAVELGILTPVEATEPCGDHCACNELDDFPQTCLRLASQEGK